MLLCYTFSSVEHIAFLFSFFWHSHYLCLSLITLCSLFFSIWYPFSPYLSYYMYVTITSLVYYPSSNRCTLLGMPFPQCSCAFHHKTYTELLLHSSCCASYGLVTYTALFSSTLFNFYCCTFCSITTCTALSPFISLFFFFHNRHSLHLCPLSPHLKHFTTTIFLFFLQVPLLVWQGHVSLWASCSLMNCIIVGT